jgi:hypothetical protein
VATLIVAKSPLSPSALAALKDAAKANEFTVLLSPDAAAPSTMLEKIVSATDRRALDQATAGFYLDLTPPTDARPFFFNQLGFAKIFDPHVFSHFTHTGVFAGNLIATLTLAMLVVISVALVAATIIIPLRPTVREAGWELVVGGTGYFALIGIGFMMIEIALLQRMSVFLGHPVYALSVVLFSLILQASAAWHPSACALTEPASLWPGAWRVPLTYLRCRSGCRSCSASMERTLSFAPAFVSLCWRRQVS